MTPARFALSCSLLLLLAAPAFAKEGGGFVVELGNDTTAVETWVRTPKRLEVEQVARSPRVARRHYAFDLDARGAVTHFTVDIAAPGAAPGAPPAARYDGTVTRDSIITQVTRGDRTQTLRTATPAGTMPVAYSSPWASYQLMLETLAAGKADTLGVPIWFVGADAPNHVSLRRLGSDSVEVTRDSGDSFRMRVDKQGRLLGVRPLEGTGKFTVHGEPNVDLAAYDAAWTAAEKASGAMGALSTRDSVTAVVGGAHVWVDYGRPARRGRVVFGGVVPFGEVWRTGANAATQLRTDRTLDFDGHVLLPGTYSVWTVPGPAGWKFVVNSQSGQWGTEHDAAKDLFSVDAATSLLPESLERFTISIEPAGEGAVLHLDWDRTRASVPFRVAAAAN